MPASLVMGDTRLRSVRVRVLRAHGLAVCGLERAAAAAGRDRVRVVDFEAGAHGGLDVIDARALEIGTALRIDVDLQAIEIVDEILIARRVIQRHAVSKAGAAPAGDVDAQAMALAALRRDQLL